MRPLLMTSTMLSALLALCAICFSQTDPKNVPQPPTVELTKFDPFLGKFKVSGEYANLPWTGTLELKKVINGWYIEQIILVKTEGIDREFWTLATWDKNAQKYRLWGFQTLPNVLDNGGEIRFAGDEMITKWVSVRPDGSGATFSNRYRFISTDELEILSYRELGNGPAEKIGFLKGRRMLNTEEAAASTPNPPPTRVMEGSVTRGETSSAEVEIRAVMAELHKAALEGDTERTASLMADEYVQTDISGHFQEKTEWLDKYSRPLAELIKTGKFHWEVYEEKDVQIRIYNDAAIVMGTFELKGAGARWGAQHTWVADANAHPGATIRFTRVFVRRTGKWLLAAIHNAVPAQQSTK